MKTILLAQPLRVGEVTPIPHTYHWYILWV